MPEPPRLGTRFSDALLSAVFCGLTLHLLFHKFEKDYIVLLKRLLFLLPLLPSYITWSHYPKSFLVAIFVTYATCYATIIISIIIYRLSPFHPLAKYPGPLLARCTKFWGVYHTSAGKMHITFTNLHRRYGPIVRTGPNELSFSDVDAIQPVLGIDGMGKGPIWDGRRSPKNRYYSLIGLRNTPSHLQRRKRWNKAFNISHVKEYEPILRKRVDQLVRAFQDKSLEGTMDFAEWMSFFSYDFMGDMAFGGGFELMRDGDVDGVWKIMESGIRFQALTQHIPWASPILFELPGMTKAAEKLLAFVISISTKRVKRGIALTGEDLSSHLLDEGSPSPNPLKFGEYASEAFLAIIAGSDTSATVLSNVFFYLLSEKTLFDRLRKEIDEYFPLNGGKVPADNSSILAQMPFLNAVINEALRLQPPVPTGLQRAPEEGTGGKIICSEYIPEGTGIYIPPYVIQRDPRYFMPDPDRFCPDRWLSIDETVETNRNAFLPYSVGPMNCAGKLLAQLELRVVVSTLAQRFDMSLKQGWDRVEWEKGLEDFFVFKKGVLPVVVKTRGRTD